MRVQRWLFAVLAIFVVCTAAGCRRGPELTVDSKKSKLDKMVDKDIAKETPVQETPITENVTMVGGEDATKSSEDVKDPGSQDDTGAVAMKYQY